MASLAAREISHASSWGQLPPPRPIRGPSVLVMTAPLTSYLSSTCSRISGMETPVRPLSSTESSRCVIDRCVGVVDIWPVNRTPIISMYSRQRSGRWLRKTASFWLMPGWWSVSITGNFLTVGTLSTLWSSKSATVHLLLSLGGLHHHLLSIPDQCGRIGVESCTLDARLPTRNSAEDQRTRKA